MAQEQQQGWPGVWIVRERTHPDALMLAETEAQTHALGVPRVCDAMPYIPAPQDGEVEAGEREWPELYACQHTHAAYVQPCDDCPGDCPRVPQQPPAPPSQVGQGLSEEALDAAVELLDERTGRHTNRDLLREGIEAALAASPPSSDDWQDLAAKFLQPDPTSGLLEKLEAEVRTLQDGAKSQRHGGNVSALAVADRLQAILDSERA